MVYDRIEELHKYVKKDIYEKIKVFLESVNEKTQDGRYEIFGNSIYSQVMSYDTSVPEMCKIEAHNKYIDIQVTIKGAEGISVFERDNLDEKISYNVEKDVVFFDEQIAMSIAHTTNIPGYFTMLYPRDAHRPQEKILGFDNVKKLVIKLDVSLCEED